MKRLIVNVLNADSNSIGDCMLSWKWYKSEIKQDKNVTVFSCFSCGGGSTMGYKRAGFNVLGNVEIDPRMNELYVKNNHPKYNYLMDIREFNKIEKYPDELLNLDILDGSPPCSTFSLAGSREKAWGKMKQFAEGQAFQTLDDLFFVFIDTVSRLRPKIVIAENVVGLLLGNAKGYVNEIIKRFRSIGYDVQIFRLNAARMDVPQTRERVFFIANNQGYKKLKLSFNSPVITYKEVKTGTGSRHPGRKTNELIQNIKYHDRSLAETCERLGKKGNGFGRHILWNNDVSTTIVSKDCYIRGDEKVLATPEDIRNIQTFPQDYDFGKQNVTYVCGMSVPPNMMANIALQIWEQWLQ